MAFQKPGQEARQLVVVLNDPFRKTTMVAEVMTPFLVPHITDAIVLDARSLARMEDYTVSVGYDDLLVALPPPTTPIKREEDEDEEVPVPPKSKKPSRDASSPASTSARTSHGWLIYYSFEMPLNQRC